MPDPQSASEIEPSAAAELLCRSALGADASVYFLVLAGTYVGMGALAHDFNFAPWWLAISSILVWAAPAQVILIAALGTGQFVA